VFVARSSSLVKAHHFPSQCKLRETVETRHLCFKTTVNLLISSVQIVKTNIANNVWRSWQDSGCSSIASHRRSLVSISVCIFCICGEQRGSSAISLSSFSVLPCYSIVLVHFDVHTSHPFSPPCALRADVYCG